MSGHKIVWAFERDTVTAKAVCVAPLASNCRLGPVDWTQCECESVASIERDEHGPYHEYEGSLGIEVHRMKDSGECHVCLFLNESGCIEEMNEQFEEFEIGSVSIEAIWDCDDYLWKRATS